MGIMQDLYHSEINVSVSWLWDGGIGIEGNSSLIVVGRLVVCEPDAKPVTIHSSEQAVGEVLDCLVVQPGFDLAPVIQVLLGDEAVECVAELHLAARASR